MIGGYGLGGRNEREDLLTDWCHENSMVVTHAWATYGPRAKSGPPRLLIRPANKFSRAVGLCNISIFIYIMCCSRLPNLV